jgi:hypothetical protein
MEIFGGFMMMVSILGLFLAVVWLIMPFVVIAMKGKQDRSLEVLESMDKRLAAIEEQLRQQAGRVPQEPPATLPPEEPVQSPVQDADSAVLPLA